MKKLIFILFLGVFCTYTYGQSTLARNTLIAKPSVYTIKWLKPNLIKISDAESKKFINFEGADCNYNDNYLPRYNQKIDLKNSAQNFDASILNGLYEPLSDEEAAIAGSSKIIGNSIVVTTNVLTQRKKPYGMVSFIPIRKNANTGKYEKLVGFDLQINPTTIRIATRAVHTWATNSVLQSGTWHKIAVANDGIYKLSYSFLSSMGIDLSTVDPRNMRVYGNGGGMLSELNSDPRKDDLIENAIYVKGDTDGVFDATDYALFYGTGPNTWKRSGAACTPFAHTKNLYSDSSYYFITFDLGLGKRIQTQASSGSAPTNTVTSFDDYAFNENDETNFIKSGRDWWGEYFENNPTFNFPFTFPNIDMSAPASVNTRIASRYIPLSFPDTAKYNISCQTGSAVLGIYKTAGSTYDPYAVVGSTCFSFTPNNPAVTVTVTKATAEAIAWLDYIEVNARRHLTMFGTQMAFRDLQSVGVGNIAQYNLDAAVPVQVWDVTNPSDIMSQALTISGSTYQFALPSDSLRQFVAYSGSAYLTPSASGTVQNQNLHALSNKDLIIVAYPDFYDEAMQLASFHETHDTLSTVVVTPQQIYNEFSSGSQDISAIRDFVKMFYDRAGSVSELPRYLLLVGDGSYDNKKRFSSNTNFIPTYQSFNSLILTDSYVSDDFYGLLDDVEGVWNDIDNDAVDIGIGRLPVKSKSEAQSMVNKILAYTKTGFPATSASEDCCGQTTSSTFGDWRNTICFVGDDEDGDTHEYDANKLATLVDTTYNEYNVDKIYLDSYPQEATPGGNRYPGVTDAINKRIEKGCLIWNYTGHGGEVGLAHERIIEVSDINSWNNLNNMPLFFTATCEFARYDDPERTSAGEYVILNPNGGGIALFTTVRLVYSTPNFLLNKDFYTVLRTPVNGELPRLGDLYQYMKNQSAGYSVNGRNFTLLGDPAVRLVYPEFNVITDTVNNVPVTTASSDTLKALSLVTVSGHLTDHNGNLMSSYSGVLYPTVFDKAQNITTLSNDGVSVSPPFTFTLQKNVLYKGKVSVNNGYFKFTFVVPKDIAYLYGKGRISYYAENGTDDANGYYEKVIIGGSNDAAATDVTGPDLGLYLNNAKFVFGGLTDENPDLFATLKDANGINTVGNGIGHDITAVLDANTENSIVLNDYYQADLNSYKSGKIRYPFNALSDGKHTLNLKVWDVYNNSSQSYTEFIVAKSATLALSHVLNYPNPFTTKTSFYFEHNQTCELLEVQLQIFTVSGKLVKSIDQYVSMQGNRSDAIDWDGRDDFGDKIGRGVYIYRLKVKTNDGSTAEKYEKLVILN